MNKIHALFLVLLIPLAINAQDSKSNKKRKDVLKEKGLTRSSLDYSLFTILSYDGDNTFFGGDQTFWGLGGGSAIRFSSNWYFTPNHERHRIYFRTNWIRIGVVFADGILFPSAPLNIGLGDNIKISDNVNLDFSFSGGLVLIGPGFLSTYVEPVFAMYPEVQLQLKNFSFGLSYSRYAERYTSTASFYHYIGVMIVHRLGR